MSGTPRKSSSAGRRGAPPKRPDESFEPAGADARDTLERRSRDSVDVAVGSTSIPPKEFNMPTKKALVVGIDDYGGPPNELTCCVNDADAFARALQSNYGFEEVRSLRNNDATIDKVDAELRALFGRRNSSDRVVLFFSGLGFTRAQNGVIEECLVLRDGLFDSERFLATTAELPSGICTTILDCSFAGASDQYVADGTRGAPEVAIARTKVWRPTAEEAGRLNVAGTENKVTEFRRFACRPISSPSGIAGTLAARSQATAGASRSGAWSAGGASLGSAEEGQLAFGGVQLCASLETESAAANTSRTDGHSAFTHALLNALRQLGPQASTAETVGAARARLVALGFRQTPRLIEQTTFGDLKLRRFLTLEPISAAEAFRNLSEPRYWEGVLTAATPQVSSAWAVNQEVNQMTMQQPFTSAYQQPFNTAQYGSDDVSRTVSAIGPALAAVIPQIVNSVLAQQRFPQAGGNSPGLTPSLGTPSPFGHTGVAPFGIQQQPLATADEVQRLLPVLSPILSAVIPAVVPQIVNNILAQQRAMSSPWGSPYGSVDPWQAAPIGFQNPGFQSPFGRI